jgi:putative ABC transport system permease protein
VAQTTVQRRHEMGVRMTLGATRHDVLRLVLRDGLKLLAFGLGAGLVMALGGGSVLERFLFGVSGRDVTTLSVVSAILACVALVACAVPAWHAARADPTAALRSE